MLLLSYKRKWLTMGLLGNRISGRQKSVTIVTFRMISCDVTGCGFHQNMKELAPPRRLGVFLKSKRILSTARTRISIRKSKQRIRQRNLDIKVLNVVDPC